MAPPTWSASANPTAASRTLAGRRNVAFKIVVAHFGFAHLRQLGKHAPLLSLSHSFYCLSHTPLYLSLTHTLSHMIAHTNAVSFTFSLSLSFFHTQQCKHTSAMPFSFIETHLSLSHYLPSLAHTHFLTNTLMHDRPYFFFFLCRKSACSAAK